MSIKSHLENINALCSQISRPVKLMEVCGTHTMVAFQSGLRSLLPKNISLLSGPGCPVCVTPNEYIDRAVAISKIPGTTVATFGDMIRVPATESSLELCRAQGAQVHIVYSPADALNEAIANPAHEVVFLGVGFETTIPAIAWTIQEAHRLNAGNYSVLCGHKTIPLAMQALAAGELKVDGFMCPGHVSVIIGAQAYELLAVQHHIPCVVTGFEALDMILGIEMLLKQIINNKATVEIEYSRSVSEKGNEAAQKLINTVFEPCDSSWRGIGTIPQTGLKIRKKFEDQDAEKKFGNLKLPQPKENKNCLCGEILRGVKVPYECKLFRTVCTPSTPVGACMVSSEGSCAAYYKYSAHGMV